MISSPEFDKIIIDANAFYGLNNRKSKVIEECAELIQAISKLQSQNPAPNSVEEIALIDHICDEISDVEIVLASYKKYLPVNILQKYRETKIKRLKKRIDAKQPTVNKTY